MNTVSVRLPSQFSSRVAVGDSVTAGQVIAQNSQGTEVVVNIPQELDIPIGKVKKVLKKVPGDTIHKEDLIAVKKNFFGAEQAAVISQVDGIITRYERGTGNLIIQTKESNDQQQIISPVDGAVTLCNNEKIVIATSAEVIVGTKATGISRDGQVFFLEESFTASTEDELAALSFQLDRRAIGKIVVGGKLTKEVLAKGLGIGAIGMIGAEILEQDLAYLTQRNSQMPIFEIAQDEMKKLYQWKDVTIYLDTEAKTIRKVT